MSYNRTTASKAKDTFSTGNNIYHNYQLKSVSSPSINEFIQSLNNFRGCFYKDDFAQAQ